VSLCICALLLSPVQKLVVENMDVLVQMRNLFDKPEEMAHLKPKLPGERGAMGEEGKGWG